MKPGTVKLELEVVQLGEGGVSESELLVHDETNRTLAGVLARLEPPHFPVAMGVLYCDPAASYERLVTDQVEDARQKAGLEKGEAADINALLREGYTWTVD